MKKFILISLATITITLSSRAGWFNDDSGEQKERERREHAEQQLAHQEDTNGGMAVVVLVLAVGCVGALVIGAAVGSKTRRAANPS